MSTRPAVIGSPLVAFSVAAVAAAVAGALAPPAPLWRWWLVAASALALLLATRRPSGVFWPAVCGLTAALASCAFAVDVADTSPGGAVPARFVIDVRDGWVPVEYGWRTRVRVISLDSKAGARAHPRELTLYLGGSVGGADLPAPGSRWEGSGELRPGRGWRLARPTLSVKSLLLLRSQPGGSVTDRARDATMRRLYRAAGTDPDHIRAAGLAAALVTGRREGLPSAEVASLRRSGLAHLLAVSGLHVGLVAALGWVVLLLVGVPPMWRRWATVGLVVGFALLAGGGAPVRRAALAAVLYLVARQMGRPLEPLPTVWGVVALLVLVEPSAVLDPGFQLSAGVTLALVRWARPLAGVLPGPRKLAAFVAIPLVAQAAAFPLIGAHFGQIAPLGVAANLLAAPLALLLVAMSLLSTGAAWVSAAAAAQTLAAVGWLGSVLGQVSRWAEVGAASYPPVPAGLAVVLTVLGAVALTRHAGARIAAVTGVLAAAAWLVVPSLAARHGGALELLPVRDGMALLLESPKGRVLVDAGRDPREAARALARMRVRDLAALVLSHPDADHVGGAAEVLERTHVDALLFPESTAVTAPIVQLRRIARRTGARELPLVPGQRLEVGGMRWRVLWPPGQLESGDNDASLAALVEWSGVKVMLTGDLEARGELRLLGMGPCPRADVLQLPHHGSRTSSTESLLESVRPRVAVAATGLEPRFAYPHAEVVARLRSLPSLLVSQRAGFERLWWDDGTRLVISLTEPVGVPLHDGGRDP